MTAALSFAGVTAATATRPSFELSIGGAGPDDWASAAVAIAVDAGLAPAVDAVEITASGTAGAPTAAVGDDVGLSLGYDDANETVFTGIVQAVRRTAHGTTRITAANGGAPLAALRVNQSYEQQSAGDIVGDLAGQAGVAVGSVATGADFAFYVVDDRRSAWQHIAALAVASDALAHFTVDGELSFGAAAGAPPTQTFTYGKDVLALSVAETEPAVGVVTAIGEGAAGSQGADAWSWLVKDPAAVTATAGTQGPERVQPAGALRSRAAAESAAAGRAAAGALTALTGSLTAPGAAAVVVGGQIAIADAPDGALNGTFLVREVRHRVSKRGGFRTTVVFSGSSGGGALGAAASLVGGLL